MLARPKKKAWFALNNQLCGKPPRKFAENVIFSVFPNEIKRLKLEDIVGDDGGPCSMEWFFSCWKASTGKGCEFIYVGSSFAVVVENLTRKNPGESEFLMSDTFSLLLNEINKHDFSLYSAVNITRASIPPTVERNNEMAVLQQKIEAKGLIKARNFHRMSPPKALKSPPKCSTPKGSGPPVSFTDDSSSGDSNNINSSSTSSVAEISANTYLVSSTKKRKIREKVEAAMSDVES